MKFVEKLRGHELEIEINKSPDGTSCSANIKLPPYGSYSRGEMYTAAELYILIKKHIKEFDTPKDLSGRYRALKNDSRLVTLLLTRSVKNKKQDRLIKKNNKLKSRIRNKNKKS
tara:strand:+ start:701 stop:1042 length:342 start_codon:yes stop_codon:yes gene_type:complete